MATSGPTREERRKETAKVVKWRRLLAAAAKAEGKEADAYAAWIKLAGSGTKAEEVAYDRGQAAKKQAKEARAAANDFWGPDRMGPHPSTRR